MCRCRIIDLYETQSVFLKKRDHQGLQHSQHVCVNLTRKLHADPPRRRCHLNISCSSPPLQSHSSQRMRRAKLTAGRGCHVQELQTRLLIAWVNLVTRGDLKQCSAASTTGSRKRDRLLKFSSGISLTCSMTCPNLMRASAKCERMRMLVFRGGCCERKGKGEWV